MNLKLFAHARDIPTRTAIFSNADFSTDIMTYNGLYIFTSFFNPCLCVCV
jgi:hypothetical protein